ncbi:MAG: hypothetical protein K0S61_700 [Anaerocolumna sp.]|jgi:hypothetical protein|nr:hypothetical protein [Anaerocolumna sp.]
MDFDLMKYVTENALVLIPALYVLGMILKGTESVADKNIPLILLPLGILGSVALSGLTVQAVIQGVLVVGAAVYTNQLFKQIKKDE